jgi:integrase
MAGSVRQDGSSWYYVLETKVSGKRKQIKKRGFRTKREAQRALTEVENAVNRGTFVEPSRMSYGDYLEQWMNGRKHNLSRQTHSINMSYIRNHIIPSLGNIRMSEIRANAISNFVTELHQKGLAGSTAKRIYNIVNASLNHAERTEIIPKNFASLVETPRVQRKELQVWDIDEIQKFLDNSRGNRYYIAFHLALMTGMRQGEILGLRWEDVDFETKLLSIVQTLSHDGKEIMVGAKTKSSVRNIALDDNTIEELRKHRKMLIEEKLKTGSMYKDSGLVVCTSIGTKQLPRSLVKVHDKLLKASGLSKITFHDLRHTHATLLFKNNTHPKVVSERLGHSSIQMTLDTYTHLLPNMQHDAITELGKLVFKSKQVL